jgi:hypothetical protein
MGNEDGFYENSADLPEDIADWQPRASLDKRFLKVALEEDGLEGLEFALGLMRVAGKTTDDKLRNAGCALELVPVAV